VAQLRAGDTLYLRGGEYTGPENTIDSQLGALPSGSSFSNPITIAAAPSESVTIRPPDGQSGIRLRAGAPAYLIFQDLIIDMVNQTTPGGGGASGVFVSDGAHHNRFLRLEVKNNSGNGFAFGDNAAFNEVIGCSVHDNGNHPGVNLGYGFYVSSSDNLFDGNEIYNNNGYGMHFYDFDGPLNVARNVIRNNRIYGNGGGGGTNYGIVVAWGDANVIHDNEIYDNRGGILIYTNSSNAQVYNNTLRGITHFEGVLIQGARSTVVRDNHLNGSRLVDLGVDTVLSNNQ
jgi:parallel beta-helix repeat protein